MTIDYLTNLYRDRTHIQGDKLAKPYKGKWIEITGSVEIMIQLASLGTTVTVQAFSVADKPLTAWIMFPGTKDQDRLEIVKPNGVISAVGKIEAIEHDQLRLVDCQLL